MIKEWLALEPLKAGSDALKNHLCDALTVDEKMNDWYIQHQLQTIFPTHRVL